MLTGSWDLRRKYMSALQDVKLEASREIDAVQVAREPTGILIVAMRNLLVIRHELLPPEHPHMHALDLRRDYDGHPAHDRAAPWNGAVYD